MNIEMYYHELKSGKREQFIQITDIIQDYVTKSKIKIGCCKIFVPHTTAGIMINENADPDVGRDIMKALEVIFPKSLKFLHSEGNSDAHVKAMIVGCDLDIQIENGHLLLGQWQGIYFCEFDGPRNRKFNVQIFGE